MASPSAIFSARPVRASRVADLAAEARRANPPNALAPAWAQIAENAEPGGVATSEPQPVPVTFRQAVSRWYENTPGGFDAAVENSQRAMKEHGSVYPRPNSPAYGHWHPDDVDAPTPVRVNWAYGPFDARGTYSGSSREVAINPVFLDAAPKSVNPLVEHELTHALMDKRRPEGSLGRAEWQSGHERFDDTPDGSVTLSMNPKLADQYGSGGPDAMLAEKSLRPLVENEKYIMQRAELDPRIAEVRRRHAFYTGKDVLTPEDAADAWEWWRANREWLEDISTPTDWPSMMRSHFDTYDSLPPASRQIMFKRMTQVPALLAPIAVGASQPGVLSGLTEDR